LNSLNTFLANLAIDTICSISYPKQGDEIKDKVKKMAVRLISSTEAQNNFGKVISDVSQKDIRYVVERHSSPKAIILSLSDLERLINDKTDREEMRRIVREQSKTYDLGESID
jgi:prevent-host-death family protein